MKRYILKYLSNVTSLALLIPIGIITSFHWIVKLAIGLNIATTALQIILDMMPESKEVTND